MLVKSDDIKRYAGDAEAQRAGVAAGERSPPQQIHRAQGETNGMAVVVARLRPGVESNSHGWLVDFHVENPQPFTVIYQNVSVVIESEGAGASKKLAYRFTEGWEYCKGGKVLGATDGFLVPIDPWRRERDGAMHVEAVAWAAPGPMDPSLQKRSDGEYWGTLHGTFQQLLPTGNTTSRSEVIQWNNMGKPRSMGHYTKGKDLRLRSGVRG